MDNPLAVRISPQERMVIGGHEFSEAVEVGSAPARRFFLNPLICWSRGHDFKCSQIQVVGISAGK